MKNLIIFIAHYSSSPPFNASSALARCLEPKICKRRSSEPVQVEHVRIIEILPALALECFLLSLEWLLLQEFDAARLHLSSSRRLHTACVQECLYPPGRL